MFRLEMFLYRTVFVVEFQDKRVEPSMFIFVPNRETSVDLLSS